MGPRSWFSVGSLDAILKCQQSKYPFLPAPFPCDTEDVTRLDHEMLLGSRYAQPQPHPGPPAATSTQPATKRLKKSSSTWVESPLQYPSHLSLDFCSQTVANLPSSSKTLFVNLQKSGAGKTEAVAAASCSRYITLLDMTSHVTTHRPGLLGLATDIKEAVETTPLGLALDAKVDRFLEVFATAGLLLISVFHHHLGKQFAIRRHEAYYRLVAQFPQLLHTAYQTLIPYSSATMQSLARIRLDFLLQVTDRANTLTAFCSFLFSDVCGVCVRPSSPPCLPGMRWKP